MDYSCIIFEVKDQTAIITLNRPKVLNAMNRQMWLEIMDALEHIKNNKNIKVAVFTGHGRAFSTGADLKDSKDRTIEDYRKYLESLQEASRKIIYFEKPTLAAVNGYALGSGYELALACDIRFAASDALIGSPEARVTSSVTGGAFRLIQNIVGPGKARELLFTAENITGEEAEKIGLVNYAVPSESLMEETLKMADKIAANSAFSLAMIKKGLLMAQGEASLNAVMDFEIEACLACVSTKERQSSLEAFEKRKE
ncbi:Enoyl-CoA hydratase/carnithine racemase [Desulfamplus magnetovallimortis]|uniref:Enoyl-CoA hydratase/carnithine racemase n=1 Tax=Desulfamplus magnetovallimortis TaxID=1246637 RepID=L0R5H7_9BACT|nr:enoyl-CoA hydratase/isomerase family protein [Desulfamplus magnetovallimortis]CCO06780.1 Enoyl-CoA hydratase/carnithine racemase [Desulfamplus magnetovallimortis BW-1]SLM32831.1 Enoyl-CoA hydratase/carnithine racemase [Desulfamplus magnetovallimortis]